MAVEESIKIKIQANAEEFKIVSDIINKELGKLDKNFQILEGNINQASSAMKRFDSSSKGFNKGLMSISLILQDLPYGFRGIQNNLPALAQGFGLLYLAVSAVTAAMTYFVLEGDKMSKGTKQLFEVFKDFVNGIVNDLVNALYPAFKTITESINTLWNMFGDNILSVFKDTWDFVIKILRIAGNQIATIFSAFTALLKGDWKSLGEIMVRGWKNTWNALIETLGFSLKTVGNLTGALVKIFNKDLGETIKTSTASTADYFTNKFKFAFKDVEKAGKKIDVFSLFGGKKKAGKETKPTLELDRSNLERLKALESYYKDDIFMRRYYALEALKEEEKLAMMRAIFEKSNVETLANIQESFSIRRQEIEKGTQTAIQDIRNASYDYNSRKLKEKLDEDERIRLDADNRNLQNSLDFLKIQADAEEKILNKKNKGDTQARIAILESYRQKLYDLASIGGWTSEQLDKIDDALQRINAAIEGSKDQLKDFKISATDTLNTINSVITNLVRDSIAQLAENIGKALGGEKVDLFAGFAEMIADAAISIGKALIAYGIAIQAFRVAMANPVAAVIAGAGLVLAGSLLKATMSKNKPKEFANGGIISGPTYGLMGEYPGASSNPEVVAPLDKLKGMIGGAGVLETRISGNDLWVVLNRTQKNRNNTF